MKYDLRKPCSNCPFRSDIEPFISSERAEEIITGDGEFACHKTTVDCEGEDGEGERRETENSQHCAGFLILREKIEHPSQMMRICERLGIYDRTKLDMSAPVHDSIEDLLDAHEMAESERHP